jgi:DNA polymerase III subunit beta
MHFAIQKEVLVKALRDVSNAIASRVVQPVLSNVLVETVDETSLRFVGTDLDLTIQTTCPAVVYGPGSITLPGKKLLEIVSKLPSDLVSFQIDKETCATTVTCRRSRFNLTGLPAADYPRIADVSAAQGFWMQADTLRRAIIQTAFAAASYDSSSILGGVYLVVRDGFFEATATDGSRLAHRRDELGVVAAGKRRKEGEQEAETEKETKSATATLEKPMDLKAIVPARACNELLKILDAKENGTTIRVALADGQIVFENDSHFLSTRLISGEYPRYHELFPTEFTYLAQFAREEAQSAVERVAVMSDERTNLIKFHFEGETAQISSNTPDVGGASEEVSLRFEGQVLDIAVNVRYVLDVLQKLGGIDVRLEMTGPLKPLIFKSEGDENYKYLLMPVQAK